MCYNYYFTKSKYCKLNNTTCALHTVHSAHVLFTHYTTNGFVLGVAIGVVGWGGGGGGDWPSYKE